MDKSESYYECEEHETNDNNNVTDNAIPTVLLVINDDPDDVDA